MPWSCGFSCRVGDCIFGWPVVRYLQTNQKDAIFRAYRRHPDHGVPGHSDRGYVSAFQRLCHPASRRGHRRIFKEEYRKGKGRPVNAETGTDGKDPPGTGGCRVDGKLRAACPPRQRKGGDYRQKCGCGYLV